MGCTIYDCKINMTYKNVNTVLVPKNDDLRMISP